CSSKSCIISCTMLCITANQILISFLENFTILFNFLRGSHPIGALPKHLLKIFKNVESNQDRPWNPNADPQYLVPQSQMLKLFHHVRNKIKERERDRKRKEKQSIRTRPIGTIDKGRCLRSLIADFINGDILFLNKCVICSFVVLSCDLAYTCSSSRFLDDFLHIFNHFCGCNTTCIEKYSLNW
ncbi:hypothetical protein HID58_078352, partial [Brassica napus]